ncbi:MAG: cohesin domain-containing protein [Phycisphaerales bacterium]
MRLNQLLTAASGLLISVSPALASTTTVEPTKIGGDYIAGSGIPATGFLSNTNGDVSVYLKARGRPETAFSGVPVLQVGNTFTVLSGFAGATTRTWWNWDFQFTPSDTDTGVVNSGSPNYALGLFFDTDPTGVSDFGPSAPLPLFDADADQLTSWDDNDGFFTNPGPGLWSDDTIDYVFSQSWRYEFLGIPAASLGAGDYEIVWAAYADPAATASSNPLVSTAATVRVIDASITNLTLDAQDPCVTGGGNSVTVEVNLANAQAVIEGGQFFLTYDNTKLDFVSADPAGTFSTEVFELVDEVAGTIVYATGVNLGDPGTDAAGPMATLTFTTIGEFCAEDSLVQFDPAGVLPTRVTDDTGTDISGASLGLSDLGNVTSDSVAPVLSLPSDITVNADAGLCTAAVDPGMATATDNCSPVNQVTVNGTRSDSLPLTDPYPTGVTTITWVAEDACGNSTMMDQTITVNASNTLMASVELQATVAPGPFDRCITFELTPTGGGAPVIVEHTMTFTGGLAVDSFDVPCGDYECITARDTLHTLRSTDNDDFGIAGTDYVADFTTSGDGDELIGGNLNDDDFIDILDFGVYIGQFGTSPGADTPCGFVGPHADISGDGDVLGGDFTFIQINFLQFSEADCPGALLMAGSPNMTVNQAGVSGVETGPVESITVRELRRRGLGHLASADLTGDGVLDQADMWAFLSGARPDFLADLDGDGVVGISDLERVAEAFRAGTEADVDRNGVTNLDDLRFVIDRIGSTVLR